MLLISSFLTFAQSDVPKKAINLVEKANDFIAQGDLEKAMDRLEKAREVYPDYAGIYATYGKISVSQNKMIEAREYFQKAMKLDPKLQEARRFYAQLRAREGQQAIQTDMKEALEIFKEVLELEDIQQMLPNTYTQLVYTAGRLAQQLNRFEESNGFFEQFLSLPDVETQYAQFYAPTFFSIAINHAQLKNYQKSNESIKKFLELNPTVTDQNKALVARANYYIGSNNFELLEAACEKIQQDQSIEKNKEKNEKMAALASEYEDRIVPYLKKAIELDPNFEDNYKFLGNFYARQLKTDAAIEQYERLIEKFPGSNNIDTYQKILETLKKTKESQKK